MPISVQEGERYTRAELAVLFGATAADVKKVQILYDGLDGAEQGLKYETDGVQVYSRGEDVKNYCDRVGIDCVLVPKLPQAQG